MSEWVVEGDSRPWRCSKVSTSEVCISSEDSDDRIYSISEYSGNNKFLISDGSQSNLAHVVQHDGKYWVHVNGRIHVLAERDEKKANSDLKSPLITAPMPGKVLEVLVDLGEIVESGQTLLVIEAMKMEHRIKASIDGVIETIEFGIGDQIEVGDFLVRIAPIGLDQ